MTFASGRRMSSLLAVLAVVGQAPGQERPPHLPLGETVELEMEAGRGGADPVCVLACDVETSGEGTTLLVFAASASHDPSLRIEDEAGGILAEDQDSGGGGDALVELELTSSRRLRVLVSAAPRSIDGIIAVRGTLRSETAATRAAAVAVDEGLAAIGALVQEERLGEARARLLALEQEVSATPGAARSPALLARQARILDQAMRLGDLDTAEHAARARHEEFQRTLPPDHPELQRATGDLAQVLRAQGNLRTAWQLQVGVVEVFERTLGPDHPHLHIARANLASLLVDLGDLRGALHLQQLVEAEFARQYPEGHPRLWIARQNLAATMHELGDAHRAKSLQESVIAAWSRVVPDEHPALQSARINLAAILGSLGDLDGARLLVEGVLATRSRTLPADHPRLQTARGNLAKILAQLGELDAARDLQEEVVEILESVLPAAHPHLLTARENLAVTLARQGSTDRARGIFEGNLRLRERDHPDYHPDLFASRLNLATVLFESGDLRAARALLEKALSATETTQPATDISRTRAQVELARVLAALGADAPLGEVLHSVCVAVERRLLEYGATLTPRRCAAAVAVARSEISTVLELLPEDGDPDLEIRAFRMVEAARGLETAAHAVARGLARASEEELRSVRELETQVALARHRIASLARAGADVDSMRGALEQKQAAEAAHRELCRRIAGVGAALDPVTPRRVASELAPSTVAVGYWRSRKRGEPVYLAWVVSADGALRRLELGPAVVIDELVAAWRAAVLGTGIGRAAGDEDGRRRIANLGRDLRRRLVDPVRDAAAGSDRWLVAMDDVLHLLPLDALCEEPSADGDSVVGDSILLRQVTGLRAIPPRQPSRPADTSLLLVGGIDYENAPEDGEAIDAALPVSTDRFPPLAAARREIRAVAPLFETAFPEGSVEQLTGRSASKRALTEKVRNRRYLHVATHAWFAPDSVPSVRETEPLDRILAWGQGVSLDELVRGFSPMVLCGLALAGANREDTDGVITAEELAGLDLSTCELATLSGCETGLGLRRSGQGLASLKQALHIAGARASVTSLWSVPDRPTRHLMTELYRNLWIEGLPADEALQRAKKRLRSALDENGAPRHATRDWAGWMLTGR